MHWWQYIPFSQIHEASSVIQRSLINSAQNFNIINKAALGLIENRLFFTIECSDILRFVAGFHCIALCAGRTRRSPGIVRRVLPACTILANAESLPGRKCAPYPDLNRGVSANSLPKAIQYISCFFVF